ncbi:hypothetical protein [Paenarthrobacter sp. YJN-5]|uniref:hypothetical protein n=1 Tax=Paenarthrobacter sp. YJN-5 TaxID=2735316 RepID=UPI001D0C5823|nr:hypothetical protein [Paenarthrobacter sp. YJN-5]
MTPRSDHRFFLPRHGLVFEASWRRPARTVRSWVRAHLHALAFGGPIPGSPEHDVDPVALTAAVELLEEQDIDAAAMAFTDLGYVVQVHAPR